MGNDRKQYLTAVLLILLSAVLCVLIYTFCLRQIPSLSPFSSYYRDDYWVVYLVELAGTAGVGIFLTAALMSGSKRKRRICGVMMVSFAVIYGIILYEMGYSSRSIEQTFEELLVSLWPFITFGFALLMKKLRREGRGKEKPVLQILAAGLYYLVLLAAITCMQKMIFSEFYKWEPLKMIYLMVVAALSWKLTSPKTGDLQPGEADAKTETVHYSEENIDKRNTDKWIYVLTAGIPAVIIIAMLICNERVRDILESLKNPVTAIQGVEAETNWLGNRLALMMGAWRGDLSLLEEPFIAKIAGGCPLLWVDYVQGSRMAFLLLVLSLVLLCGLLLVLYWLQNGRKRPFLQLLGAALLLRSCIGVAADLLVLTTTDVGLLLLRNPGDVILVIFVVMSAMQVSSGRVSSRDE